MAAINPEDLEKLKKFIDFVSANPLILNVPQLGFLKRFIEKFGGKVPEGEYQMPAGGKCPFGGDAKTETKTQPPPTQDDDAAEPVVEEESEESEVELDMEETDNVQLLEPNVLYLDEKPPKIVKPKKVVAARKQANRKKKPPPPKRLKKSKKERKNPKVRIKVETKAIETAQQRGGGDEVPDDPLCTNAAEAVDKEIKMETEDMVPEEDLMKQEVEKTDDKLTIEDDFELRCGIETKYEPPEEEVELHDTYEEEEEEEDDNEEDKDFDIDEDYVDSNEDCLEDDEDDDNVDDDEDDEPLIMLTRKKGRPRKYHKEDSFSTSSKIPRMEQCRDICKQKCTQKFSQEQRQAMCELFWSLSSEEKKQFIRQRTKTKRFTRLKRKNAKSRGNNCCYYLNEANEEGKEPNFIRVCRKYFESTLCITNYKIKKALEGYEPEMETEMKPPVATTTNTVDGGVAENKQNKAKGKEDAVETYLDPETGDLITIDPKEEKKKLLAMTPKKKRTRRKPGDPEPEHFPKPIKCAERCIHKCHTKFTEEERKQICDVFWSMDYKRRKDFVLARIETKDVETTTTPEFRKSNRPPRAYHTRFFLRTTGLQGENKRVCKHFMMATLAINRQFITNAIDFADKTTGFYTGTDRRGHNGKPNKIGPERKQTITDHISSYPAWMPNKKSKTRYLHHSLNIKRMYNEYKEMCMALNKKYCSNHYYYRSFHEDFRLAFLSNPEPRRGGGFMKSNPNVSHYTGNEPGGVWLDPKGEILDLSRHHPAESFIKYAKPATPTTNTSSSSTTAAGAATSLQTVANPPDVSSTFNTSNIRPIFTIPPSSSDDSSNVAIIQHPADGSLAVPHQHPASFSFNQASLSYAQLIDSSLLCQQPQTLVRHDFNPNLYEVQNLSHSHASNSAHGGGGGRAGPTTSTATAAAAAALFRKL
ncbi:uncharacterized protein isoform X2 [Musca autumnalis]|uniref:uncharacterized protein isoform X2 n=1 Tax=Musca autumnalis TaxID=221902 RepID=UPI003CED4B72